VKGFIAVPAHDGKVTAKDVADAIASAKRLEPPAGRSTLLYMRQPTMLDNKAVGNPVGMTGKRLEVNFWRVTMEEGNMRMRVGMVNGLSIRVRDFILASHAAACATASDADKQGGCSWSTWAPARPTGSSTTRSTSSARARSPWAAST
jgi:cell division ATPase FtsA